MRVRNPRSVVMICICLAALFMLSAVACLILSHHDCEDGHCEICACLERVRPLFFLPAMACALRPTSGMASRAGRRASRCFSAVLTPVSLRVQLNH